MKLLRKIFRWISVYRSSSCLHAYPGDWHPGIWAVTVEFECEFSRRWRNVWVKHTWSRTRAYGTRAQRIVQLLQDTVERRPPLSDDTTPVRPPPLSATPVWQAIRDITAPSVILSNRIFYVIVLVRPRFYLYLCFTTCDEWGNDPVNTIHLYDFIQCWTSIEDVGPTLYKIILCKRCEVRNAPLQSQRARNMHIRTPRVRWCMPHAFAQFGAYHYRKQDNAWL